MSPGSGMSEEERRELIARQRNALYGEGPTFTDDNGTPRPGTQSSIRGQSPLAFQQSSEQPGNDQAQSAGQPQGQQRSRANSTSSPASNPNNSFSVFDNVAQQSSRTSTSSPGGSPPRQGGKSGAGSGVAPIGTRPSISGPSQAVNPALNKRSTTPLPSPLSFGFAASEDNANGGSSNNGIATSGASNPSSAAQDSSVGWGSKSGVWGKSSLGVQASVWG